MQDGNNLRGSNWDTKLSQDLLGFQQLLPVNWQKHDKKIHHPKDILTLCSNNITHQFEQGLKLKDIFFPSENEKKIKDILADNRYKHGLCTKKKKKDTSMDCSCVWESNIYIYTSITHSKALGRYWKIEVLIMHLKRWTTRSQSLQYMNMCVDAWALTNLEWKNNVTVQSYMKTYSLLCNSQYIHSHFYNQINCWHWLIGAYNSPQLHTVENKLEGQTCPKEW